MFDCKQLLQQKCHLFIYDGMTVLANLPKILARYLSLVYYLMKYIRRHYRFAKNTIQAFIEDDGMKLSASLSYYTIFSIAPFLIIIISVVGLVFGREAVAGKVFYQIKGIIGKDAAIQIQQIIANVELKDQGISGTIIGLVILLIGATGVFTEIQSSINYMWNIKAKPEKGLLKLVINRIVSFSLIVSIGFILLVSLLLSAILDLLYDKIALLFNSSNHFPLEFIYVINLLVLFAFITILFAIIFKVLPDAIIRWRDSFAGASFTAGLFILGKFLIGMYIGNANLGITYGAAASVVIILVWVYYTSMILYLGAEFTKIYSREYGEGIKPNAQSVYIIKTESKELPPYVSEIFLE